MAGEMTLKDDLEIEYWLQADLDRHRAKLSLYLWAFGCYCEPRSVLEIGCGPLGGFLPLLFTAERRVGVDPLCERYQQAGLMVPTPGVEYVSQYFDQWGTRETFDAIFATDSLDHGDMGFHLIPKIASLLNPGGMFYLHVHLRPADYLNLIHDHGLTLEQLDAALAQTSLVECRRDLYPADVDGEFPVPSLVGVWCRP